MPTFIPDKPTKNHSTPIISTTALRNVPRYPAPKYGADARKAEGGSPDFRFLDMVDHSAF